ncbi:MAG: RNA methyltransferase [Clostridia bacterium]|nr:RNA methyltransferase [Clostridia bacterium]
MDWKTIESRSNPAVKFAASLSDKKARDKDGVFPSEGITLFFDFCQRGIYPQKVYLSEKAIALKEKIDLSLNGISCEKYLLSPSAFEKVTTEKGSQGLVCVYSTQNVFEKNPLEKWNRLVALECIQDPGNVGTIIRTAASFGFDGVLLVSCASLFGPKAIRASMGAISRIPIKEFSDTDSLFEFLNEKKVKSVAACLKAESVPIHQADLSEPVCVLIGNEGHGLSEKAQCLADSSVIIPISGMESLNAAAAATVFLWEIGRRGMQGEG